jgi:hypothetical protein
MQEKQNEKVVYLSESYFRRKNGKYDEIAFEWDKEKDEYIFRKH